MTATASDDDPQRDARLRNQPARHPADSPRARFERVRVPVAMARTLPPMDVVRTELAGDPTIDITTTGRRSGLPRRIEIWMLDVDGRFFITGTPGRRDWLANLIADPDLVVHLKRRANVDLPARATTVDDARTRRRVLDHLSAAWYRDQEPLDTLVDTAPMVEISFDPA